MIPLNIHTDAERSFGLDKDRPQAYGDFTDIGLMRNGTAFGRAVVMVQINLPDGTQVVGQTTWALFHTAARALAESPIAREETTFDPRRPD